MTTDIAFPYGTFPVDAAFHDRYTRDYSAAGDYPLPGYLPHHHPLLKSQEGTYLLEDTLPPWWPACVSQVEPEVLQPLLSSISAHEFRTGCIEQARWKTFRESLASEPRHLLPASPKIAALVEQTAWTTSFANRGPVDTAESFSLVISTHPQDFLFMSNGRDWRSCQHFSTGCENHQLPGNFYDTNVAVALVLLPNTSVGEEESVLVRTTLRIFLHQEQPLVTIGRTYHNNETLALLLLCKLAEIFDIRGLSWGFICGINALAYCQDDFLGPALSQRLEANIQLGSVPFCLPRGWYTPYIDKGSHHWERDYAFESDDYSRRWLNADVRPMRPAHSQSPTHPRVAQRDVTFG